MYAKIVGDVTICSAYSHELPKYGLEVGLTNYAACYCTGAPPPSSHRLSQFTSTGRQGTQQMGCAAERGCWAGERSGRPSRRLDDVRRSLCGRDERDTNGLLVGRVAEWRCTRRTGGCHSVVCSVGPPCHHRCCDLPLFLTPRSPPSPGLLCARRLLKKLELDEDYEGCAEPDGEMFLVEQEGEKRPFTCVLDVGLIRTTTGNRVFGALKGAVDGGLNIPHSEKRFPGYDREAKDYDVDTHKKYIFGGHVAEYMELLQEEDPERYQSQFAKFIEKEIEGDGLEELYQGVHEKIREDPEHVPTEKQASYDEVNPQPKKTLAERKATIQAKKDAMRMALEAADDDDDDEDED